MVSVVPSCNVTCVRPWYQWYLLVCDHGISGTYLCATMVSMVPSCNVTCVRPWCQWYLLVMLHVCDHGISGTFLCVTMVSMVPSWNVLVGVFKFCWSTFTLLLHKHAGEAIIMLFVHHGNFANVVTENIIKTQYIRITWSMCIICNPFWFYRPKSCKNKRIVYKIKVFRLFTQIT